MTEEEELLYYCKHAYDLIGRNKEYISDPDFEKNFNGLLEFIELLKDVLRSKKEGDHKYDFVDYESDQWKYLINKMKQMADCLTELEEGLN